MFGNYPFTRIVFGRGSFKKLSELAGDMFGSALLVAGRSSARAQGLIDSALSGLASAGVKTDVYEGVESDPSDRTVAGIAEKIIGRDAGLVVALGGGSVMDAAKMANACASLSAGMEAFYDTDRVRARMAETGKRLLPLIACPTTSGSGSEVTRYAVITDTKEGLKKIVVDFAICPSVALVDPELTLSCPSNVTMVSGLDTLSHLIEGYLNFREAPPFIDRRALEGTRLVLDNLPRAVENGSEISAREQMGRACVYGGMVITYKGTGLPHGFSFSFFDSIPHGSGVTLTLPYSWAYSLPAVEAKTRELARVFGVSGEGDIKDVGKNVIGALMEFYRKVGHPTRLSEIEGIDQDRLRKAASDMLKNPSKLANAPRPVPPERSREILEDILNAAYSGDINSLIDKAFEA